MNARAQIRLNATPTTGGGTGEFVCIVVDCKMCVFIEGSLWIQFFIS